MCEAIPVIVSSSHLRRPLGGGHGTGDNTGMLKCVGSCLCLAKPCRVLSLSCQTISVWFDLTLPM